MKRRWLLAASAAVAAMAVAPASALADTNLGQLGSVGTDFQAFLWNFISFLQRLTFFLAIPAAIIGGILLMLGRHAEGRRLIWATVAAVLIAIFVKPIVFALPGIVAGASFP
jgi:hypothetical protein